MRTGAHLLFILILLSIKHAEVLRERWRAANPRRRRREAAREEEEEDDTEPEVSTQVFACMC